METSVENANQRKKFGNWSPNSWQKCAAIQQPVYPDAKAVNSVVQRLADLPPLVTSWEIENLKSQIASAAYGKAFLLQGGDCSERIEDCNTDSIVRNLKVLIQMSFVLTYASNKRVIRVGRIAGTAGEHLEIFEVGRHPLWSNHRKVHCLW